MWVCSGQGEPQDCEGAEEGRRAQVAGKPGGVEMIPPPFSNAKEEIAESTGLTGVLNTCVDGGYPACAGASVDWSHADAGGNEAPSASFLPSGVQIWSHPARVPARKPVRHRRRHLRIVLAQVTPNLGE